MQEKSVPAGGNPTGTVHPPSHIRFYRQEPAGRLPTKAGRTPSGAGSPLRAGQNARRPTGSFSEPLGGLTGNIERKALRSPPGSPPSRGGRQQTSVCVRMTYAFPRPLRPQRCRAALVHVQTRRRSVAECRRPPQGQLADGRQVHYPFGGVYRVHGADSAARPPSSREPIAAWTGAARAEAAEPSRSAGGGLEFDFLQPQSISSRPKTCARYRPPTANRSASCSVVVWIAASCSVR